MSESSNGWDEHRIYVTKTLEKIDGKVDLLTQDLANMKGRQHTITTIIAGGISALVTGALEYLHHR